MDGRLPDSRESLHKGVQQCLRKLETIWKDDEVQMEKLSHGIYNYCIKIHNYGEKTTSYSHWDFLMQQLAQGNTEYLEHVANTFHDRIDGPLSPQVHIAAYQSKQRTNDHAATRDSSYRQDNKQESLSLSVPPQPDKKSGKSSSNHYHWNVESWSRILLATSTQKALTIPQMLNSSMC